MHYSLYPSKVVPGVYFNLFKFWLGEVDERKIWWDQSSVCESKVVDPHCLVWCGANSKGIWGNLRGAEGVSVKFVKYEPIK